ncbi:MAG: DMT family transporter [Alphaproteobacteria bacterium]|nr:DMT family transporter [Alphaproteobacteria bacterium]MDE2337210.1 DMT family transporter [Alphaproteobacteria bacterium]
MSRLKADLLLLLVALIWGLAFIAEKVALDNVGPCTFVAARFSISALLVLPFALKERRRADAPAFPSPKGLWLICAAFSAAVILQQVGIGLTTVTNAGFITGLYVIFVPAVCGLFYGQKLSKWVFPAAFLSLAGIWMLSGGSLSGFSAGDALVFACAVGFALQVALAGKIMAQTKSPFTLSCLQYAAVTLAAIPGAMMFEHPTLAGLRAAAMPILYGGIMSGGIAYTLQIVCQQHTPAPDSAIILSSESVFAAIAGAMLLGERLTPLAYGGCALITCAILMTEMMPLLFRRKDAGLTSCPP